ncbi:hypothetical protein FQA39_LY11502 [Lamprigera yunnana]|nr:hypothetical protein FQA39_LY11502 [Lamprigera yunnana]
MLKTLLLLFSATLVLTNDRTERVLMQIFNADETVIPSMITVAEGDKLILKCRSVVIGKKHVITEDHDVVWSKAQNWRLQKFDESSIKDKQKNEKLIFNPISREDQGRYICTSTKYNTSRILYVVVQFKNQKEHYYRKRNLLKEFDEIFGEDGNDSSNYKPQNSSDNDEVVSEPEGVSKPDGNGDDFQATISNANDNLLTEIQQNPELFIFQGNVGVKLDTSNFTVQMLVDLT